MTYAVDDIAELVRHHLVLREDDDHSATAVNSRTSSQPSRRWPWSTASGRKGSRGALSIPDNYSKGHFTVQSRLGGVHIRVVCNAGL
ncbi:MAG TPA: hypothetical protein VIY52_12920 [Streptosporangiaceae bacterium]